MPPITALLHTRNDALRLGRALEMLLPCAEILIVDHDSGDATHRIAHQYGARIIGATRDAGAQNFLTLPVTTGFSASSRESPSPKVCRSAYSNGARCRRKISPGLLLSLYIYGGKLVMSGQIL
jgi:glycosyltransferase involved in cell wall biosynthesis